MAQMVKNLSASAGDIVDGGWIPGSGRSPGGGHGDPLQYSCLENSTDRGAWRARVHRFSIELDMTEAYMYTDFQTLIKLPLFPYICSQFCGINTWGI